MLPVAIRVLAATGVDLLQQPELVDRAWAELDGAGRAAQAEAPG